jgi:hypothetical protein
MFVGLQDKKKSLDTYYLKWDDRFPYRKSAVDRFRDVIDLLQHHLAGELRRSRFRKPALFYSLFLVVYQLRYGTAGSTTRGKKSFGEKEGRKLRQAVQLLDNVLAADRTPRRYTPFVKAVQRQTDNIAPRKMRHQTILAQYRSSKG